ARVPVSNRSPAPGSSVSADRCATSRICLSPSMARSRAWMDLSRPTNNGMTMCGNTTTSRSGRTGSSSVWRADWVMEGSGKRGASVARPDGEFVCAPLQGALQGYGGAGIRCNPPCPTPACRTLKAVSRLWAQAADGSTRRGAAGSVAGGGLLRAGRRRLVDQVGLALVLDHRLVHHHLADVFQRGQLIHRVQQDGLHDRAQPARAGLALDCLARDGGEGVGPELQVHALHLEQLAELLGNGVLRLGEDPDKGLLVQLLQGRDHRQAPDELRDQAELHQVLRLDLGQDLAHLDLALGALDLRAKPDAARLGPALADDLLQPGERTADDEQDIAGIDRQDRLLRVLAPARRRDAGQRALEELEQRLLHALARHVTGDRGVVGRA